MKEMINESKGAPSFNPKLLNKSQGQNKLDTQEDIGGLDDLMDQ